MKILAGCKVATVALDQTRPLLRYLATLGAEVVKPAATLADLDGVDFLIDGVGLPQLQALGWESARITATYPALIHVTVSPFGSHGPAATLLGSELVASAMSGTLRLVGEPDRCPVKEALDACTFHADMVAAAANTLMCRSRRLPSTAMSAASWPGSSTSANSPALAEHSTTAVHRYAASGHWPMAGAFTH